MTRHSRRSRILLQILLLAAISLASPAASRGEAAEPALARRVILFIGDGMGPAQVEAAGLYHHGEAGRLSFERLPHHARVGTDSTRTGGPTDSAAAATAIATALKVDNGVIALDTPRTGRALTTVAESFKADGRAIGVVTTDALTGATPASFVAHVPLRKMGPEIAEQILTTSKPDVIMGASEKTLTPAKTKAAGYLATGDAAGLGASAERAIREDLPLAATFPGDRFSYRYHDTLDEEPKYGRVYPTLAEMTTAALAVLDHRGGERGFFLMVESALIDKSGHANRLRDAKSDERILVNCTEVVELHEAVGAALAFAEKHPDTLVLVTADHETGGLEVIESRGQGAAPKVSWANESHTRTAVDVWAVGPGAERVAGATDNTDVYVILMRAAGLEPVAPPRTSTFWRGRRESPVGSGGKRSSAGADRSGRSDHRSASGSVATKSRISSRTRR